MNLNNNFELQILTIDLIWSWNLKDWTVCAHHHHHLDLAWLHKWYICKCNIEKLIQSLTLVCWWILFTPSISLLFSSLLFSSLIPVNKKGLEMWDRNRWTRLDIFAHIETTKEEKLFHVATTTPYQSHPLYCT